MDVILIIVPALFHHEFATALVHKNALFRLISKTLSQSSLFILTKSLSLMIPAVLTSTSTVPKLSQQSQ